MINRIVYVWTEPQTIEVCHQSNNVWVAEGSYDGAPIRCEAVNEIEAVTAVSVSPAASLLVRSM